MVLLDKLLFTHVNDEDLESRGLYGCVNNNHLRNINYTSMRRVSLLMSLIPNAELARCNA
jgi:hypothetical protein